MKRLHRSRENRMIAGVLGGIGEHLNIDPTLVRLIFVIALLSSFGILTFVYILAVIIIPSEGDVY
ncbi:PspC domain-containing protein [Ornithinibacillus gellani]|uniref:PspC domain-containing protein n=1 Tax=Ornithinibacillus gellani TaxID=2293253 RepID=UPI000F472FCD|nr:PspC domain-containing protein [Ornithinibacillus gellani]TQS74806.1 PspC domain-containing protein [Ornithinibacillus gellani]